MRFVALVGFLCAAALLALVHPGTVEGQTASYRNKAAPVLDRWDFSKSRILRSRFAGSVFSYSFFDEARFENSAFQRTTLQGCRFDRLAFERGEGTLRFARTDLKALDLDSANVNQGRWEGASIANLRADRCELSDIYWSGGRMTGLHLYNTRLSNIRFERVEVYGGLGGLVDWCDWSSTRFYHDDFDRCAFDYCEFTYSRFERAEFRSVTFRYCDFSRVELEGCDISGMTIDGIDVEDAVEFYKNNRNR